MPRVLTAPYHATCVLWRDHGLLFRGPSGAGKSDLAFRLIGSGAVLVADDLVHITKEDSKLIVRPLPQGGGLLEVRGVGVVRYPFVEQAVLSHVLDLVAPDSVPRLPEAHMVEIEGVSLPCLALWPFETSAVAKIAAWLDGALVVGARQGRDDEQK